MADDDDTDDFLDKILEGKPQLVILAVHDFLVDVTYSNFLCTAFSSGAWIFEPCISPSGRNIGYNILFKTKRPITRSVFNN